MSQQISNNLNTLIAISNAVGANFIDFLCEKNNQNQDKPVNCGVTVTSGKVRVVFTPILPAPGISAYTIDIDTTTIDLTGCSQNGITKVTVTGLNPFNSFTLNAS